MERMLVVVFDNERKAYEGVSALRELEFVGAITINAGAVIVKHADGTVSISPQDDLGPIGTLLGTSVGSLIGILGGPVGVAVGAASGFTLGGLYDLDSVRVSADFVDDVSKSLTPNKVAIVAELDEGLTMPVDTRMEALGGMVFRRTLREVRETLHDREIAAMKADLALLKEEMSEAHAEQRAKLQKKTEQLQAKIEAKQQATDERREAFEQRQKSKGKTLRKNALAAHEALKELAKTSV